jgi:ABC-type multidrug transport system ATPase subunit/ABC-type multidrug transport system permease subunit
MQGRRFHYPGGTRQAHARGKDDAGYERTQLTQRPTPGGTDQRARESAPSTAESVRVDAVDVTETVREGLPLPLLGSRKVLLDDVSITLRPGAFVAILGASGAGKTMLLRALSGQMQSQRGDIFYNGLNLLGHRHQFSTTTGFVPQDDIVHKNLRVEDALEYAACLRLPCNAPRQELVARVEEVLEDVDLTDQRKQLISRLSGGQRKRVNIALELLGRPTVFYLDEPTSGLDPGLDLKMMQLLRRLADRGQTVVLVTHTTSNIDLCDDICFLAPGGRLAYFGPPDQLKAFFHRDDYAGIYNLLYDEPERWAERFRQSPDYQRYVEAPHEQPKNIAPAWERENAPEPGAGACDNSVLQFWYLTRRYVNVMVHDLPTLLLLLLQAPIIAGLVWLLADRDVLRNTAAGVLSKGAPQDVYAQEVLFTVVVSAIWFGIINAAREIVKEAPIYRRERAINLRLFPYVLSKVAVLGALLAVQDFILFYIVGTKAGYPANGLLWHGTSGAFAELYVTLLLSSLAGLMMGLVISALVPNSDRAVSIVPVLLIPQIIFASVIFELKGDVGRWISTILPSRWGMQAVGSIDHLHDKFTDHSTAFYAHDAAHVLAFWGALAALTLVFFVLTLLAMRRKDTGI